MSTDMIAIQFLNPGKKYRICGPQEQYPRWAVNSVKAPLMNFTGTGRVYPVHEQFEDMIIRPSVRTKLSRIVIFFFNDWRRVKSY